MGFLQMAGMAKGLQIGKPPKPPGIVRMWQRICRGDYIIHLPRAFVLVPNRDGFPAGGTNPVCPLPNPPARNVRVENGESLPAAVTM